MTREPPAPRAAFPAFRSMQTRWKDNDAYGHMNNAEYLSLFDTAISLWQMDNALPLTGPDALRFVVVESGCRYHAEAGFPDTLHVGLRIGHLGRSSFRFDLGLFRNEEETACTEGFFAMVHTGADGRPAPLPDTARERLATIHAPQG